MTLTLWRGERLLGELWKRAPSPRSAGARLDNAPTLAAFLIRAAPDLALEGVWQIRPFLPGVGVQQKPVDPDIVAERGRRAAAPQPNAGPQALGPMSPEQIAGVPPEMQLTIRDERGQVWLPRQIHLLEVRYEPERAAMALREAPPEALVEGSIWCVSAAFESAVDAPGDATGHAVRMSSSLCRVRRSAQNGFQPMPRRSSASR